MNVIDLDLEAALASGRYVWVKTNAATFMGFVVGLAPTVVMIRRFLDFTANGYVILRRDVVEEVAMGGENLDFFERMMRLEGVLEQGSTLDFDVPLLSMGSALEAIRTRRNLLVMLHRADEDPEEELIVGTLLSIAAETRVRQLTAAGRWAGERTAKTSDIVRAAFHSPYLRALAKYGDAPPT